MNTANTANATANTTTMTPRQAMTATTAHTLAARIRDAKDRPALAKCQRQIDRHYSAGTITAEQYGRLDVRIMEELAKLDSSQP